MTDMYTKTFRIKPILSDEILGGMVFEGTGYRFAQFMVNISWYNLKLKNMSVEIPFYLKGYRHLIWNPQNFKHSMLYVNGTGVLGTDIYLGVDIKPCFKSGCEYCEEHKNRQYNEYNYHKIGTFV